jgi:membrane-associated protease RseP (regulator of RpoE activity)
VREFLRTPWANLGLFLLTVLSTFYVGAELVSDTGHPLRGWVFAVPLLAILVTHEFGHWIQARRHRVDASLPYFLPLPLPPLGTLGAVIAMRGRIKTRDALLDIGASGPIAGLVIAIPVLIIGLRLSTVEPIPPHGLDEGQSLLYLALKRIVIGPIPSGHDVFLHPTAFAGWAGLFMTMLNLLPIGQLDGGHVAYSLFGLRQDRYSRLVHRSLLAIAAIVGGYWATRAVMAHAPWKEVAIAATEGKNWLIWWVLLGLLTRGGEHPPTDNESLSPSRRLVAWGTLAALVLLFMPVPFRVH